MNFAKRFLLAFPELGKDVDLPGADAVDRLGQLLKYAKAAAAIADEPKPQAKLAQAIDALTAFVSTVDNTGGCTEHTDGQDGGPFADPEWLDLGDAYRMAEKCLLAFDGRLPERRTPILP